MKLSCFEGLLFYLNLLIRTVSRIAVIYWITDFHLSASCHALTVSLKDT